MDSQNKRAQFLHKNVLQKLRFTCFGNDGANSSIFKGEFKYEVQRC